MQYVSQRTTKAGDILNVFTLPCSPGLKSDILDCLIRHHAGQLPLDLGRMGPARAFAALLVPGTLRTPFREFGRAHWRSNRHPHASF